MVRVKGGVTSHRKHKRLLKTTKGYRGLGSRIYTQAKQKSMLAGEHAYRDRKNKKRTFRSLWIVRLSAALRAMGWKYGEFSGALGNMDTGLYALFIRNLSDYSSFVLRLFCDRKLAAIVLDLHGCSRYCYARRG